MIFESDAQSENPPASGGTGTGAGSSVGSGGGVVAGGSGPDATAGAAGGSSILLIDDFEDGDQRAVEPAGWWYAVNDGTSSQSLLVEQDPLRQSLSLHTTGAGFSDWGAALGVDLAEVSLDARMSTLRFDARSAEDRAVAVQVIDDAGVRFTYNLTITATWQEYTVRLDQLYAAAGDGFVQLDVASMNELHWFLFGGDHFDVWIDDVVIAPE